MKKYILLIALILSVIRLPAQVWGKVVSDQDRKPLAGVSIYTGGGILVTATTSDGTFKIPGFRDTILVFSHIGFKTDTISYVQSPVLMVLHTNGYELNEVVISTGYQSLSQRQSTGSYTYVDEELINRSMHSDIISRMEGVTGSLAFIRKGTLNEQQRAPELRIRGKNTIYGDGSPLIILDNFPYEGDINSINPNDIESVTLLKDAASAAIWGAKAGNGVLVITTKKGKYAQPLTVSLNGNFTVDKKPDLHYSRSFMKAMDFIEVERELYNRAFYVVSDWNPLSPVVEYLMANNPEEITRLNSIDYRNEALERFYQNSFSQQYFLNVRGGGSTHSLYLSAGFDKTIGSLKRSENDRITLQTNFSFRPFRNLELTIANNFILTGNKPNGLGISSMYAKGKNNLLPYTQFTGSEGSSASITKDFRQTYVNQAKEIGLLDWQYRPIEELLLNNISEKASENRTNVNLSYKIIENLRFETKYQYHTVVQNSVNTRDAGSYYVRDLVNKYTQTDGTRILPEGSIVEGNNQNLQSHSVRSQISYELAPNNLHYLSLLVGAEAGQLVNKIAPGYMLYGVDRDVLVGRNRFDYTKNYPLRPTGSGNIPAPSTTINELINRSVSAFGNASYIFRDRYSVSASVRRDGANVYGVKTNQRFVPLWSAGLAWIVSEEDFWSTTNFFKIRASYGYSGNSLKNTSAYTTAVYSTEATTGLQTAIIRSPGNPSLSWESVLTQNFGLDFAFLSNRLTGSLEYFIKKGIGLIGDNIMDPTTGLGFPSQGGTLNSRTNYANTRTGGLDIQLVSKNTTGKLKWTTVSIINVAKSKVTEYAGIANSNIITYTSGIGTAPPVKGAPTDPMYSLPWYGLDSRTGSPLVPVEGSLGYLYGQYLTGKRPEDLVLSGSTIPLCFGSVRNTIDFKQLTISANIVWKANYYFRASSINYHSLFNTWTGHIDYADRWQKTGDELLTNVPSLPTKENYDPSGRRDQVYTQSLALVEKGDHIRLNDVAVSYMLKSEKQKETGLKSFKVSFLVQNIGILWRRNSVGIDPDYPYATYPPAMSIALGFNANF